MYKVSDYIYVESIDELERPAWIKDPDICIIGLGVFHDAINVNYPHAFKYHDSLDNHCCGDWYPCKNRDMIKAVDKSIDDHKMDIEKLRNLRKTLKENI